jgi:hypothetical protein
MIVYHLKQDCDLDTSARFAIWKYLYGMSAMHPRVAQQLADKKSRVTGTDMN